MFAFLLSQAGKPDYSANRPTLLKHEFLVPVLTFQFCTEPLFSLQIGRCGNYNCPLRLEKICFFHHYVPRPLIHIGWNLCLYYCTDVRRALLLQFFLWRVESYSIIGSCYSPDTKLLSAQSIPCPDIVRRPVCAETLPGTIFSSYVQILLCLFILKTILVPRPCLTWKNFVVAKVTKVLS